MQPLSNMLYALIATTCVALISLSGVLFFGRNAHIARFERMMLPVAVGVFLSVIFFELIPETFATDTFSGGIAIVTGFILFYVIAHLLETFHCHHEDEAATHGSPQMILFGDAIHNVTDGIVIATAFMINPAVGIATTIGIALHEVPQEIAEFAILISLGYSRTKAALYNLLSASSIVLGALLTFVFIEFFQGALTLLIGFAAGSLLYIAASDLLPHIQRHTKASFAKILTALLVGLIGMTFVLTWSHKDLTHDHESEHTDGAHID